MILELELTDVWRENNPQCKRYTWRKPNPFKQARLDFILLSDHLMWHFDDTDILPGYRSDHSIVMLKLKFGKDIKHNTFWKFNRSLLRDKEYLDQKKSITLKRALKKLKQKTEKTEEDIKFLQNKTKTKNYYEKKG